MVQHRVLVLGGSGLVGSVLVEQWAALFALVAPAHAELDVLNAAELRDCIAGSGADTVVNLVAWADVDGAEPERGDTTGPVYRLNVDYPRVLARLCGDAEKHLIHVSTDYVFDGTRADAPYTEADATRALCWYAETKLLGEQAVLNETGEVCVARIEMPFTGKQHRKRDLARTIATRLERGQAIQAVVDQRITPVFLDDAAVALGRLLMSHFTGVIHVAAANWTTPHELACALARRLGLSRELVQRETFERFSRTRPARRPQHSWLDVARFTDLFGAGILRPVEDELEMWAGQWQSR